MMFKIYRIHKRDLALKLAAMNNVILDKEPNKYNDKYMVYIFEDTDKLHKDLTYLNGK